MLNENYVSVLEGRINVLLNNLNDSKVVLEISIIESKIERDKALLEYMTLYKDIDYNKLMLNNQKNMGRLRNFEKLFDNHGKEVSRSRIDRINELENTTYNLGREVENLRGYLKKINDMRNSLGLFKSDTENLKESISK